MYLNDEELAEVSAKRKALGISDIPIERMHVSPAPGATRSQVVEEILRVEERIADGDFEIIKSIDSGTVAWWKTYKALRDMGWTRRHSIWHLIKKFVTRTKKSC